ncbi:MAG: hypothetical protein CVU48_01565 [Candidatus Cloacimonetes bacterium HGW-Cloacimonetes-1]|jgi:CheY-like chemotaxis protein|nr:MAG: hypothetical protein CVU48_01565 [Candidatus Cloacimonetes bacterium HGW-Cloacimonetes-1]
MYKILFIDEDPETRRTFVSEFDDYHEFEIVDLAPINDLNEMVIEVCKISSDVVIIDYRLNDKMRINYNGVVLRKAIKQENTIKPVYLFSHYIDELHEETDDVWTSFEKGLVINNDNKQSFEDFISKMKIDIEDTNNKYTKALFEYNELLTKWRTQGYLGSREREELLNCDSILGRSQSHPLELPKELKDYYIQQELNEWIESVNKLVSQLEQGE